MRTIVKIDEASYFLAEMKKHYNDKRKFRHSLSAFLAAGRSVADFMKSEFNKEPGYLVWGERKMQSLNERERFLLDITKKWRNETVHHKPIALRRLIASEATVPHDFDLSQIKQDEVMMVNISKPNNHGEQMLSFPGPDGELISGAIVDHKLVNENPEEEDIYELCKRYHILLMDMFNEWLSTRSGSELSTTDNPPL